MHKRPPQQHDNFEFDEDDLFADTQQIDLDSDGESQDMLVPKSNSAEDRDSEGKTTIIINSSSARSSTLRVSLEDYSEHMHSSPARPILRIDSFPRFEANPEKGHGPRLGTSAPINIPNLVNWRADKLTSEDFQHRTATFVPPHQLSQQEEFVFSFSGASPSATMKRERLRARNAILRSTGFIEGGGDAQQVATSSTSGQSQARTSRLTQALTTIGEV